MDALWLAADEADDDVFGVGGDGGVCGAGVGGFRELAEAVFEDAEGNDDGEQEDGGNDLGDGEEAWES
ncbi:MAG: hypothetical protein P8J87_04830 [Verrucomicrobiales bacterium]|nr:hypothetical protein [Verrucomicrobiales bacterium]